MSRPVNISTEMARLEGIRRRSKEDDDALELLGFRKKVITEQLTAKPVEGGLRH
jgi:hypothetical protein